MKLSVVIPYINAPQILEQCVDNILEYTVGDYEIILIDNGSTEQPIIDREPHIKVIRNDSNVGVPLSLLQGADESTGDIIYFGHSDTLIHERGWDQKVINAFRDDPKLGMAGFFGAMIWGADGGRARCYSNLQGRVWGASWQVHQSAHLEGVVPAATLDGLGLLFSIEALADVQYEENFLNEDVPPHHFYDRIWPGLFIENGYHVATIGVACDHLGGATANSAEEYFETATKWCNDRGIEIIDNNPDLTVYREAERMMFNRFSHKLPLIVDNNYNYKWSI